MTAPLTVEDHLGCAYDHMVRGKAKDGWTPTALVEHMKSDPEMRAQVQKKADELARVIASRGEGACFVTATHYRALSRALEKASA